MTYRAWIAILPRKTHGDKSKEQFISRFVSNKLIDPISVMRGFIPEMVAMMNASNQTIILMLDQSKISEGFECLMVSLRIDERAIPVAWKVFATSGSVGFEGQEPLLDHVKDMIPEGVPILLSADRLYGNSAMISARFLIIHFSILPPDGQSHHGQFRNLTNLMGNP
jgi:hypothetical protein